MEDLFNLPQLMLKIAMYTGYRITSRKEKNTMYHCSYGARYANFLITYSSNRDEKIKRMMIIFLRS